MNILRVKKYYLLNKIEYQNNLFTYSPLEKAFEKQTKTIEDQGEKQVNALKSLEFSVKQLPSTKDFVSNVRINPEIISELKRIEEQDKNADKSKMTYKGYNKAYNFRKFKTIRAFGNNFRTNFINM